MEPSKVCHSTNVIYMCELTCFRLSLSPQQHPDQFLHGSPQLAAPTHAPLTRSPPQQFAPGIPVSTTAQDLLNNVLGLSRTTGDGSEAFSSLAPQASMLFGSGTFAAPTKSIWTVSGLGSTAPKHTILPQQTPNKSYIGQERRQSLSQMKTPSANTAFLPGSPSLASFTNTMHHQYAPQGVSASDLFHLHSTESQRDPRSMHAAILQGQALDGRYQQFQGGQGVAQHAYPPPMASAQRAWNT